jgi:hypothetical protein
MSDLTFVDGQEVLFERLEGSVCEYPGCSGQLTEQSYKSDRALVCEACSTPAVRVLNHG